MAKPCPKSAINNGPPQIGLLYTRPRATKRMWPSYWTNVRSRTSFPSIEQNEWEKRSKVTLELPLFPNYLFVRAGQKASLLSVPGVVSIVGSGREPWPLPDHEIVAFRSAVDVCKLEPHSLFAVGERVRIKNGALAGMQGVLVRKKSNFRVVLTVEAIMSSVAAEVDEADLEAVDTPLHTMSLGTLAMAQ